MNTSKLPVSKRITWSASVFTTQSSNEFQRNFPNLFPTMPIFSYERYLDWNRIIRYRSTLSLPDLSRENSIKGESSASDSDENSGVSLQPLPRPTTKLCPWDGNFVDDFIVEPDVIPPYLISNKKAEDIHKLDYSNPTLSFKKICTLPELQESMRQTRQLATLYLQRGEVMISAVLSVCAVRHTVLYMEASNKDIREKSNAWQSFPYDVAGKWDPPAGDLLLFPGAHANIRILVVALEELLVSMRIIKRLYGRVISTQADKIYGHLSAFQDCMEKAPYDNVISVDCLKNFNMVYKPIFSSVYYRMKNPKARLAVEMFQSAYLVFFKLAHWAFSHRDIGTALLFSQMMQKSVECLAELLPLDRELQNSYIFISCQWLVSRCYTALYNNSQDGSNFVVNWKNNYMKLLHKMDTFNNEFFIYVEMKDLPSKKFPCEIESSFPINQKMSLKLAFLSYCDLSLPPQWKRSRDEQETVLTHVFANWFVHGAVEGTNLTEETIESKIVFLQNVLKCMENARTFIDGSPDFRVFVNSILAKSFRLSLCMDEGIELESADLKAFRRTDNLEFERRSCCQKQALQVLNESTTSGTTYLPLTVLLKMAERTICDEVVYNLHLLEKDLNSSSIVFSLVSLLPDVVSYWFQPHGCLDREGGIVPEQHLKPLNTIIAMFFYGLFMSYTFMNRGKAKDARLEENQRYCYAVSCALFHKPHAAAGVIRAIIDHVELLRRCCLIVCKPTLKNTPFRVAYLLKRLTWALPVLSEYLIYIGSKEAFSFGYRGEVLSANELMPSVTGSSPNMPERSKVIFQNFMKYVEKEIGFVPGEDFVILRGQGLLSSGNPKTLRLRVSLHEMSDENVANSMSKTEQPIFEVTECELGGTRSHPVESYYAEEEAGVIDRPQNYDELYRIVLEDFSEVYDCTMDSDKVIEMDEVLKRLKSTLGELIEIEIISLKNTMEANKGNSDLGELSNKKCKINEKDKLTFWLSEFNLLKLNLFTDGSNIEILTRSLHKLDGWLNQGEFSKVIRGVVEL